MVRPASTLWLLAHELRLDWRRRAAVRGPRKWMAIVLSLGGPLLLGLFAGIPLAAALKSFGPPSGPGADLVAAAALAAGFMFMLSQALAEVIDALYERGDLDLFFCSPIPPQRVIAVRALAVAFGAFSIFGFFLVGPLIAIAVMGHPAWLAALPVLYACALAATALALSLSVVLIGAFGPRRTRLIGRVLAVAIGSCFFLATQAVALASGQPGSVWTAMLRLGRIPVERTPDWAGLGLAALSGEPRAFVLVVGGCVGVFLLGLAWSGPRFATLYAATSGTQHSRARPNGALRGFRRGALRALLLKETRLLLRDPMLLPQVLLRIVYLVPVGFLAVRYGASANFTALSGAVIGLTLMANQLAGTLAWMTISAEDAPDLLASSPLPRRLILRGKLAAAVGLVIAIVFVVTAPLALIAPFEGAVALGGSAAAALSAGLINLWWQRPGKRSAFRKRAAAPLFVTLAELAVGLLVAIATGLFSAHQTAGFAPAALAALILLAVRAPARP